MNAANLSTEQVQPNYSSNIYSHIAMPPSAGSDSTPSQQHLANISHLPFPPEAFFPLAFPLLYRGVCLNAGNAALIFSGLDEKMTPDEAATWYDGESAGKGQAARRIVYLGLVKSVKLEDEKAFHACWAAFKAIERIHFPDFAAPPPHACSWDTFVSFSLFWGLNHRLGGNGTLIWGTSLCEWFQKQPNPPATFAR
ncbi:hypothetical protein IAR50_006875 [Cryptococcus sp. DSM 104548]